MVSIGGLSEYAKMGLPTAVKGIVFGAKVRGTNNNMESLIILRYGDSIDYEFAV